MSNLGLMDGLQLFLFILYERHVHVEYWMLRSKGVWSLDVMAPSLGF